MKKYFLLSVLVLFAAVSFTLVRLVPSAQAACSATQDTLCNPISASTIPAVIATVIDFLIGLVGILSALFIIVGGFQFVTSAGNEENAKKARATITYAIIGLVVAIMAFVIVRIVVNTVSTTTTSAPAPAPTPPSPPPGGTPGSCTTTGGVAVNASTISVGIGGTLSISPTLQGGIPAGCTGGIQIIATVRSNTDATRSTTISIPSDGATVQIPISGPAFTFVGPSDTFTISVKYLDSSTTPATQIAAGGAVFTVTQP